MTEHDDELHDPRLTALYRRKGGEQPPARVDAEIRRAARAAVKRPAARRLWPSLATAAILVLGASVALKVFEQPELSRPQPVLPSVDRAPVPPSAAEGAREDAARMDELRVDQDRVHRRAPGQAEPVQRRDKAAAPEATPARSQFAPSTVVAAPKSLPSSPSVEKIATPLSESGRPAGSGVPGRDGNLADSAEEIDGSVPGEAPSEPDCSGYANLLELTEEERRQRLDEFRRRQDEAAIRCLERLREGVDR